MGQETMSGATRQSVCLYHSRGIVAGVLKEGKVAFSELAHQDAFLVSGPGPLRVPLCYFPKPARTPSPDRLASCLCNMYTLGI